MTTKIKKLFGILLTLALVLGLLPGMTLTALADDPYASLKNTTNVITFDGKSWYLIDYDDSTVTLLAKECVGASEYNSYNSYVAYDSDPAPTVKSAVDNYYNTISDNAKTAVSGGKMFLLTTAQATTIYNVNKNVLRCTQASGATDNHWWLCSRGSYDYTAVYVLGGSGVVYGIGDSVKRTLGVRPALKLNLSSVIFASVNLSGGANATASEASSITNTFFLKNNVPPMTSVTYTASKGYMFPATSDLYTTTNGIKVERTSNTVVTVSGTPTGAANVTVPDASLAYTVTYKVVNGTWSDGTTADKTEAVASGSKPASVPTGMKASEGYTGGTWDTTPADSTITEAKMFTYTFTAKQAATVTKAPTPTPTSVPKTGDSGNPLLWLLIALLGVSLLGITVKQYCRK